MAVRSYDEIIESAKAIIGDSTEDADIAFLEDIADTLADVKNKEETDWEEKYKENDKMWREKYVARFSGKDTEVIDNEVDNEADDGDDIPRSFEDLFKED